jgi:hypothetical protein
MRGLSTARQTVELSVVPVEITLLFQRSETFAEVEDDVS